MKLFLKLKHWQLFIFLFGIPMLFPFVIIGSLFLNREPAFIALLFPIMMVIAIAGLFGWLYSLGANLHKRLPENVPMNLRMFKIFLFIPVSYMSLILLSMINAFQDMSHRIVPNPAIFILIVPLHLFCMFCILYCFYFNAKALKSVELQRPVMFGDFIGEFFCFWFFPVGVWIVQPTINKIFEEVDENSYSNEEVPKAT